MELQGRNATKIGGKGSKESRARFQDVPRRDAPGIKFLLEISRLTITTPPPMFLVSVASKGFSSAVSLLFATLAMRSISVAAKGLMEAKCWRGNNSLRWKDFGGVRRTAWPIKGLGKRAGMAYQGGKESCR